MTDLYIVKGGAGWLARSGSSSALGIHCLMERAEAERAAWQDHIDRLTLMTERPQPAPAELLEKLRAFKERQRVEDEFLHTDPSYPLKPHGGRCRMHPDYDGKRRPKVSKCRACLTIYHEKGSKR